MNNKITTCVLLFFSFIAISQTRYIDPVFDSISSKTYTYSIKGKDTLKLDIYEPENDSLIKRPLFVILHGGGFNSGSRNTNSLINLAENVAKKGYVVTSIDYRLLKRGEYFSCNLPVNRKLKVYSNAADDLLSALEYLLKYKTNFRIDESKIVIIGISAGAETALNVIYNRELVIKNLDRYAHIKPAAVISISGALLNADLINNAVPGVFYHGALDKIVPYGKGAHHACDLKSKGFLIIDGSQRITEKLEAINSSFMFYSYFKQGHDEFDIPNIDIKEAFIFVNDIVFEKKFYQAKITQ
ncbi:alpha/beta hydrolase [Confluentibacter lentus]|uniref:alpha/beta hydrolase n=1 Tax=Confluentibacter lentus TaxID=1699412 RepID=UPI000C294A40|nr:alpha/beta hydrolase [Confluentibacter lentus]